MSGVECPDPRSQPVRSGLAWAPAVYASAAYSSQACTPAGPPSRVAVEVRLVLRRAARGARPPGTVERRRVDAAGDHHEPLGGARDDPVVRGERRDRRAARRGRRRPPPGRAPRCGRGAAGPGRPAARRRAASRGRPRSASGTTPFAASVCSRANACSGEWPSTGHQAEHLGRDPQRAAAAASSGGPRAARRAWPAEPSSTALACAPSSSDSAVSSGAVRRRPAVAEQGVDAVAAGGHRRGDAFERGEVGQRVHAAYLSGVGGRQARPLLRTSATVLIASRSSASQSPSCCRDQPHAPRQRVGARPGDPGVHQGVEHQALRLPQPGHHRRRDVGEQLPVARRPSTDHHAPGDLAAEAAARPRARSPSGAPGVLAERLGPPGPGLARLAVRGRSRRARRRRRGARR